MEQLRGSVIHIHFDCQKAYQQIPKDGWERIMAGRWWAIVMRILGDIRHPKSAGVSGDIGICAGGPHAAGIYSIYGQQVDGQSGPTSGSP